jgi:hypothetical protein
MPSLAERLDPVFADQPMPQQAGGDATTGIHHPSIQQPPEALGSGFLGAGKPALIAGDPIDLSFCNHPSGDHLKKHLAKDHGPCNDFVTLCRQGGQAVA